MHPSGPSADSVLSDFGWRGCPQVIHNPPFPISPLATRIYEKSCVSACLGWGLWYTLGPMATSTATVSPVRTGAKDTLARLMATENLTVIHDPSAPTAFFNTQTRVLTLPIYNGDMTNEMYDMFVGHEVGHALFTPATEEEIVAALDSVDPKNHAVVHDYMNVVEDARIERQMKVKYPGLGRVFAAGYKQFIDSDFFGLKGSSTPIDQMPFIDRLNLHIKAGIYCGMQIPFSTDEQILVDAVAGCKSFDDVVDVVREIYDFVTQPKQDEDKNKQGQQPNPNGASKNGKQNDSQNDANGTGSQGQDGDGDGDSQDNDASEQSEVDESGEATRQDQNSSQEMKQSSTGQSASTGQKQNAPRSQTQKAMEDKMKSMRDANAAAPDYFRIPSVNLDAVIVDYKRILQDINNCRAGSPGGGRYDGEKLLRNFEKNSREYVNTLVREFERKMAADEARRTFVGKSGSLDMSRIHSYKFSEDIFLKNTTIAAGKNHGMVMFIDWSGSMDRTLENTIYQLMNLVLFCNALRIPFEVYAFSTVGHPDIMNIAGIKESDSYEMYTAKAAKAISEEYKVVVDKEGRASLDYGDYLYLSSFSLPNLISSRMSKSEMRNAMENLLFLAKNHSTNNTPRYLGLGGTPLDEAVVAAMTIVPQFRAASKAQIVNTVFLTDGCSGSFVFRKQNANNPYGPAVVQSSSGHTYTRQSNQDDTSFLRTILRAETAAAVTGFFLTDNIRHSLYTYESDSSRRDDLTACFHKNKHCIVNDKRYGYDSYYLIDSTVKSSSNSNTVRGTDAADTFIKTMENKRATRALLTTFAGQIAKDFVY